MRWYLKVLRQYFNFRGRARRREFWLFVLFSVAIGNVLGFIDRSLGCPAAGASGARFASYEVTDGSSPSLVSSGAAEFGNAASQVADEPNEEELLAAGGPRPRPEVWGIIGRGIVEGAKGAART